MTFWLPISTEAQSIWLAAEDSGEKSEQMLEALAQADECLRDCSDDLFKKTFPELFSVRHKLDNITT